MDLRTKFKTVLKQEGINMQGLVQRIEVAAKYLGYRKVRITDKIIYIWLSNHKVQSDWCLPIEIATRGKITREELRPDIFRSESEIAWIKRQCAQIYNDQQSTK